MSKPDGHISAHSYVAMLKHGGFIKLFLPASGETIEILKAKLIQHSGYFRGIFQCTEPSIITETIHLDDVTQEVFTRVIYFVYENRLLLTGVKQPKFGNISELIDLYIFADKYDFLRLRNACVRYAFKALKNGGTSLNDVAEDFWSGLSTAFTKLPPTAKLYEMLLSWLWSNVKDMYGDGGQPFTQEGYDRMLAGLPHFIISELLRRWVMDPGLVMDWRFHSVGHYLEVEEKIPTFEGTV